MRRRCHDSDVAAAAAGETWRWRRSEEWWTGPWARSPRPAAATNRPPPLRPPPPQRPGSMWWPWSGIIYHSRASVSLCVCVCVCVCVNALEAALQIWRNKKLRFIFEILRINKINKVTCSDRNVTCQSFAEYVFWRMRWLPLCEWRLSVTDYIHQLTEQNKHTWSVWCRHVCCSREYFRLLQASFMEQHVEDVKLWLWEILEAFLTISDIFSPNDSYLQHWVEPMLPVCVCVCGIRSVNYLFELEDDCFQKWFISQ